MVDEPSGRTERRMTVLLTAHQRLAIAAILYLAIAAVWSFGLAISKRPISPSFRGLLVIAEGVAIVEAVVGILVRLSSAPLPATGLHFLYGALVVLVLPVAYAVAQSRRKALHPLIFGIALLFLFGLAIRATTTGHP